ncbi:hypothetical protein Salmuc_05106 [Salipiger mucosus DSM 16094]|uniref:Uncharacterized protein n=1 Tax=Salipiger mucosus DSM 16094 TaxID=1123237 RepID=S9RTN5_9RHOB|nr:hypothetical protein Salmuc_05106 [Salipiger mucosus DSM 16094]
MGGAVYGDTGGHADLPDRLMFLTLLTYFVTSSIDKIAA